MIDLEFIESANTTDVLDALSRAEALFGNLRSGDASDWIRGYLATVVEAESTLNNVLPLSEVSRLLRNDDYWAIRRIENRTHIHNIAAVTLAAEHQRRAFETLGRDLRSVHAHWGEPESATLLVPDTNLLIRDEPNFEDINWPAELGALIVRIVVPIIVIHEMDRLKREGNQTAARLSRRALKWLQQVRAEIATDPDSNLAPTAPGGLITRLDVYVDQGPTRRPDADGDIIQFARRLKVISGLPTVLATRDLGMQLRADQVGVDARLVDDPELLPAGE